MTLCDIIVSQTRGLQMKKQSVHGGLIDKHIYCIDSHSLEVLEYYSHEKSTYVCEEMNQYADSMMKIILAWIIYKQLGLNQGALLEALARMLKLGE